MVTSASLRAHSVNANMQILAGIMLTILVLSVSMLTALPINTKHNIQLRLMGMLIVLQEM